MDTILERIKQHCFQGPHWIQLEIQAFWYGAISWAMTCAEEGKPHESLSIDMLLAHSDAEFSSWPTSWLDSDYAEFITQSLSLEELDQLLLQLDDLFRGLIPVDLNIFSTLSNGDHLTEKQWDRLYEAIAFQPIQRVDNSGYKRANKTIRPHQRRGVTPLKRRKVHTRHRPILVITKSSE